MTTDTPDAAPAAHKPTIVLVHGLWLTPLSWEGWKQRFESKGHTVLAPSWPGLEGTVEEVRRNTSRYERLGIKEITDHYDGIIRGLGAPPVTNTLTLEESKPIYDRLAVPGPGRTLFQAAFANFTPHAVTTVNRHHSSRAPLLFLANGKDHTVPAVVTRAACKIQKKTGALTELKEYPDRSHYTFSQDGWEEVADYSLDWAVRNART